MEKDGEAHDVKNVICKQENGASELEEEGITLPKTIDDVLAKGSAEEEEARCDATGRWRNNRRRTQGFFQGNQYQNQISVALDVDVPNLKAGQDKSAEPVIKVRLRVDPHLLDSFRESACTLDRDKKSEETEGTSKDGPMRAPPPARPASADKKGVSLDY